jgi:tRNA A-37 threonylcarbamoyl transferase component Bud32/GAF domain-containing protein
VIAVLAMSLVYAILQVGFVRPYLPPAGSAAVPADECARVQPYIARPPAIDRESGVDPAACLASWREAYRRGASLASEPIWATDAHRQTQNGTRGEWARRHAGMIVQILVFTLGALLLLVLRSNDLTAGLMVMALALSAVSGGGPLFGVEDIFPAGLGRVMTVFTWLATPLAFPVIALAILYFPSRAPLLTRHPLLHLVPLIVVLPMLVGSVGTGLYLAGVDAAAPVALWDAMNPATFYACFAAALGLNVAAVIEGIYRFRFNHDANERRRIRMAVYTAVPGIFAYAVKEGLPRLMALTGGAAPVMPDAVAILLQALVLLPAFGLVYAVGVERVLGPRTVLRRSLQYALASRTLTILSILPAAALVLVLVQKRGQTIGEVASGSSLLFVLLIGASVATFKYRERARQWLDQRFFREEYDARKILMSLASRVRFETDPSDLSSMVVTQIDEALHPQATAILVSGIDEGRMTPVTVLHGSAESLPLDGGIVSMLRWSDEPLEIFLNDPRSPARRLPPEEQEWLECTGARLLVPVLGQERSLIAIIALGEKRSEEAYTAEDRQLLGSIAAQMGLGFDVARLRRRMDSQAGITGDTTRVISAAALPMTECPRCGRCEESGTPVCPSDGTAMQPVASVPRTVDNKYLIEQLLGRGGMGAVYRAKDMRLDRLVALKVVRAELLGDPEARRRFRREAQIIAKLQHPGIVAVYDFGTFADGGAYLVMELVRGEDLRRVLQREGRLDTERALRILSAVCNAIEAAHREGVLHRDLKPENILLPGGDVEAKVLDFGVAKVIDDGRDAVAGDATLLTAAGTIVGTPAYMAPEQLRGATPDARTDVFSLGVIAYEMLSGELPFGRGSLADVVLAHQRGVPPMTGVAPALERAVRAAMEPEPDRRPASPQALAHLITAAAAF